MPASCTGNLMPDTLPPSKRASTLARLLRPGFSAWAKVPITSPAARPGSQRSFWASLPYCRIASVTR